MKLQTAYKMSFPRLANHLEQKQFNNAKTGHNHQSRMHVSANNCQAKLILRGQWLQGKRVHPQSSQSVHAFLHIFLTVRWGYLLETEFGIQRPDKKHTAKFPTKKLANDEKALQINTTFLKWKLAMSCWHIHTSLNSGHFSGNHTIKLRGQRESKTLSSNKRFYSSWLLNLKLDPYKLILLEKRKNIAVNWFCCVAFLKTYLLHLNKPTYGSK